LMYIYQVFKNLLARAHRRRRSPTPVQALPAPTLPDQKVLKRSGFVVNKR
jgi:hypothetical protein